MVEPIYPTDADIVTVNLGDGKQRALRYSAGALRRLYKRLGITAEKLNAANAEFAKLLSTGEEMVDFIPSILFEGLVDRSDFTDPVAIEEIIMPKSYEYLIGRFQEAIQQAFTPADPNVPSGQPKT